MLEAKESLLPGDGTKEPGRVDTLPPVSAPPSQLTFVGLASLIEVA